MQKKVGFSILIVASDQKIFMPLKHYLQKEGHIIHVETNKEQGLAKAKLLQPKLILLQDLNLCRMLSEETVTANIPIIMVSKRDNSLDEVTSLNLGADDYIAKPDSFAELSARIRAVLRPLRPAFVNQIMSYADIKMDLAAYTVSRNAKEIKLSPIQFQILQILMSAPKRVFSPTDLMYRIWGYNISKNSRSLEVQISKLRKALLEASKNGEDIIKTEHGVGYTLQGGTKL